MNFLILFPDNKKAVTGNFCSALQAMNPEAWEPTN